MWNCPKCGASTPKTCTCAKEVPPMTAPDLDALARLLEESTQRPWSVEPFPNGTGTWYGRVKGSCTVANVDDINDTHLIAAAVNALPALLATARRERRLREALKDIAERSVFSSKDRLVEHARAALAEEGQDG